jgi:hypothetical protein
MKGLINPMHRKSPFQSRLANAARLSTILSLSIACALLCARAAHADDDYERSIRSEAQKLDPLDKQPSTTDASPEKPVKDFEAGLLLESPESFRLYQQLPSEKRLTVFQLYQQTHDFKSVRRRIIELRLGS